MPAEVVRRVADEEALPADPEQRSPEHTSTNPEALADERDEAPRAGARPSSRSTRRDDLLRAAARLFAERGFRGVGIEQIGAAVGIRGPGIYRHFPSKDAVLVELLVGISQHLLDSAGDARRRGGSPVEILDRLVRGHVEFALDNPDLIIIHDRDLWSLPDDAKHDVRRLQRAYVEEWVRALRQVRPDLDGPAARARTHALFGLINSTPHSASGLDRADMAVMLHEMAVGAIRS